MQDEPLVWHGRTLVELARLACALIIIILIVYILVKILNTRPDSPTRKEDTTTEALKILNERHARGDISEEEYLHRKEMLTDDRTR